MAPREVAFLSQSYFAEAKKERSLLKKRRAGFYNEISQANFIRMSLRRKVQRTGDANFANCEPVKDQPSPNSAQAG